jgi:hypothetical protein
MLSDVAKNLRVILAFLLSMLLVVIAVPSLNAATKTPTPSPRATGSKASPSPTANALPLTPVFADTNVPQILSISSSSENIDGDFVVSVAIEARIYRNTISSLSIGLAQKTTEGVYVDPIFQAPCTKLGNLSVNTLTSAGNSTALQSRAADGDWYRERYVLTSKTKLGTNLVPCQGQYLITSMSIIDSAKHTLNVVANLAATIPVAAPITTPSAGPTRVAAPQTTAKNNDTAIMTSNIWNSRVDLAPCTAGTNLLPAMTTVNVSGRATQVLTPPTILPTNRVVCAPTISFDFSKPLITILANSDLSGLSPIAAVGVGGGLPIFDYSAANQNSDVEKLKKEIADLKKINAKLNAELAKYKKSTPTKKRVTPNPASSPSPTRK